MKNPSKHLALKARMMHEAKNLENVRRKKTHQVMDEINAPKGKDIKR